LGTLLDVTRAKCLTNGVDIIREVFNRNECVSILERRNIERVRIEIRFPLFFSDHNNNTP
jgi:hypothetical protein